MVSNFLKVYLTINFKGSYENIWKGKNEYFEGFDGVEFFKEFAF